MIGWVELWGLLALGIFVMYWWQARDAKAAALHYAAARCRSLGVQLLDQSMVQRRIRLQRDEAGHAGLQRHYAFEFSSTGNERYPGRIIIQGKRLISIEMAPYEIPTEPDEHS